jgi:hypothetical protein
VDDLTRRTEPLLIENRSADSDYSAFFEDDGKVAYAYICKGGQIVGDVWLYNHGEASVEPEWEDPSRMPFANPKEFTNPDLFEPVKDVSEIGFEWIEGNPPALLIFIRGDLFARLIPGSKPGWSRLAIKDGPLALVLPEE